MQIPQFQIKLIFDARISVPKLRIQHDDETLSLNSQTN